MPYKTGKYSAKTVRKTLAIKSGTIKISAPVNIRTTKPLQTANSKGTIQGSPTYKNGKPGIFTKSIKGMKGKHFIEDALTDTINQYKINMKEI